MMHRRLSLIGLFCMVMSSYGQAQTPLPAHADAKTLAELLGADWKVTEEDAAVMITSEFEVFFVSMMSRPLSPPPFKDGTPREDLLKEGKPEKYVIRLQYGPRLDREERERRLAQRKPFADVLTHGASGKRSWAAAAKGYESIQVPRYSNFDWSIYRVLPTSLGVLTYPPKAAAKIGAALYLIDLTMEAPRTPYD